jgi:hypothetical protein
MASSAQQEFLDRAVSIAEKDSRFIGLALHQESDHEHEFTDLEFVFVCAPISFGDCAADLKGVAEALGPLLLSYEQEKTDAERELSCLYDEPLRRIDLRLLPTDGAAMLRHPRVLWERDGTLSAELAKYRDVAPVIDLQWMEDRFWLWLHSAAMALKEGAIFEALHQMSCLRTRILAPMLLKKQAQPADALKGLEQAGGDELSSLRATVPLYDARSCEISLREAAKLYVGLRETLAPEELVRHRRAEMAVMRHLHTVSDRLSA